MGTSAREDASIEHPVEHPIERIERPAVKTAGYDYEVRLRGLAAGRLRWLFPALFVVGLLPRVYTFLEAAVSRIIWPWQLDYVEGLNLNAAYLLSQGHNIYRHNGPDGWLAAPYPPLFYLLTAPLQAISGPSFGFGRALSVLATVVIALLAAYIVHKVTQNWAAGALAGALWLSLSPVIVWSAFFKQDTPAMMLDLGGVAWAMRYPQGRRLLGAALLFALAIYTKQAAIVGAAATTLWLLARDFRRGVRFGLTLAGLVIIPFLVGNFILQGGLWEHLIGYHELPFTVRRFVRSIVPLMNEYWPMLVIGGAMLVGLVVWLVPRGGSSGSFFKGVRERAGRLHSLVLVYAVIGWAATLTKLGYDGANFNHLMDGLLPTCMLVGLAAAYMGGLVGQGGNRGKRRGAGTVGMAAIGALLVAQLFNFNPPQQWYRSGWPSTELQGEMQGLSRLVAQTPGDMFSEDAYLLLSNGKRILYDDPSTFVVLANQGVWDDSVFNQDIYDRRFSLIMLLRGNVRWTPAGLRALGASYNLTFPGSLDVYEPKVFPEVAQYAKTCELSGGNGDAIALTGYSLPPGVASGGIKAGDTLRVQLWWRAEKTPAGRYASYVHLLNEQGTAVAGQDNPSTSANQPTSAWQPGQPVTDTASLPMPMSLQPGRYRLVTGMYGAQGGAIKGLAPVCEEGEVLGDGVALGLVDVNR